MLAVDDLTTRPVGEAPIEGVSFAAHAGEVVAIVGPNGAGKTTLVRCLALLLRAERGTILLDGKALRGEPWQATQAGLAAVLKGRRVFPQLSVGDNLRTSLLVRASGHEAVRRLEIVYDLFPILRERARQPAGTMSGGEQQMIAIARALLLAPRFMVLDEPSLGLSPLAAREVYVALRRIADTGSGVILTEESRERAGLHADRILCMKRGQLGDSTTLTGRVASPAPAASALCTIPVPFV
jgi:branched-chain amino acid transport system ATP-binding protein